MTEQEFQAVYMRQVQRAYHICCLYLGNSADAQDAVQNLFLKLLEKKVVFLDEQHEAGWFCVAARNQCRDMLRSRWWKKRVDADMDVIEHATGRQEELQNNHYLELALRRLPVKQKEVLYLYYYEQYSVREISKLLKRKESTVQSQLAAGRKKLRQQYEQYLHGGMPDEAE
ncbi:MAG: RNA polymerase sigma factor [Eubacterium sp.]|nr:RNA polymerase sigma factor [Eubacterium sp.]